MTGPTADTNITTINNNNNVVRAPIMRSLSGPILAILSGYSVTTWECQTDNDDKEPQQPITRFPMGDFPISSIAWNHNRQVIATCSAVSTDEVIHQNVVLISSQTGSRLDSFQHNKDWNVNGRSNGIARTIQFGGKSRYLCIGDDSGAVCLWDLKKHVRVRQFFHDKHPSIQVALDPSDTYVLSLSSRMHVHFQLERWNVNFYHKTSTR